MEKRKITEIKTSRKVNRKERNAQGQLINVERTFTEFVEVPTVTGWARFGHYLLDLVFYYIFAMIVAIPIVLLMLALGMSIDELEQDGTVTSLIDRLISWLIIYPGYYLLFESTIQSTPAKIILGRIVVDEYGEKPSIITILKRSYARVVPFEAFSCFNDRGWHDNWSDTYVLRKKDLNELKLAMQISDLDTKPQ